mgnify:CR=1 FL=1
MKLAVIGLGLIGGSMAIDLKKARFATEVIGVDSDAGHVEQALNIGFIDRTATLEEACKEADLVLIAVPVDKILTILPFVLDHIPVHATVTDMGSTKRMITGTVKNHPMRRNYVPAHPMAGTENSGPTAAISDLFRGKIAIMCDQEESGPQHVALIEKMFQVLGMKIAYMSADEQDHSTAFISHLPHVVAFALANAVLAKENREIIFDLASGGFRSTVRLAKSSPEMWGPIFQQNKEYILESLDVYIRQLKEFKDSIENDENRMNELMTNANHIRNILDSSNGGSLITNEETIIKLYTK